MRKLLFANLLAAALSILVPAAQASFHTFQIEQIYSSADGAIQFVVLHESEGLDAENLLGGRKLTVVHGSTTRTFTFDHDLGGSSMLYEGVPTAFRRVLVASASMAALGIITPDYVMPDGFLPTDGGTLDYASVDQVTFASLPTDGSSAYFRTGRIDANRASNFAGQSASVPASAVSVVEYFNGTLDHYFITASQPDIAALDSGRIAGWQRTGQIFRVYPSQASGGSGANAVCRFYIPPEHGNSHFFSASPVECAAIAQKSASDPNYSGYVFETPDAFYVALPAPDGTCAAGTVPVYRLWNQRADSNHRYTTSAAIKAQMLAAGYLPEGYGPDAVIMCAAA
jgi:hypothetical protein